MCFLVLLLLVSLPLPLLLSPLFPPRFTSPSQLSLSPTHEASPDDETLANDTSHLGDIRVSWFRVRNPQCILPFEPLDEDEEEHYENGLGGEDVVMHEREKKGGHRIV